MLRLGTRGSALARWQAEWVASSLHSHGVPVEICKIETEGDVSGRPIAEIGGQGLFTKAIQRALLAEQVDLAVHSLKDLPTEPVPGLTLAAIPLRASHRDVLVSRSQQCLVELPEGSRIGTGSRRRQTQLLHVRPDLRVESIRGNVDTRLKKLDEAQYEAIVLAEAGLRRLGLDHRICQTLPEAVMLPAVGQGALGLECRSEDTATQAAIAVLNHGDTQAAVLCERALLAALRGGCLAPVAAWGRVESGVLQLDAAVFSADGQRRIAATGQGSPDGAVELGGQVAAALLEQGAAELIAQSRD